MSVQQIQSLPAGKIVFLLITLFTAFIHSCTAEVVSLSVAHVVLIEFEILDSIPG